MADLLSAPEALRAKHADLLREYTEARAHVVALSKRAAQIGQDLLSLVAAARLFGVELPMPFPAPARQSEGRPTVRDFVLSHLNSRPAGVKSGELRNLYAETYDATLHAKTMGMTLYRLKEEGLSVRVGRIWYPAEKTKAADVADTRKLRSERLGASEPVPSPDSPIPEAI